MLEGCCEDAVGAAREQLRQVDLPHGQRQGAQVVAVERQDVEGVELHLLVMSARVQGVEVGDAVDAGQDRLAIDDEFVGAGSSARAFDDPRETVGPVMAVAGPQAHASAVALNDQATAVVFDLLELGGDGMPQRTAPSWCRCRGCGSREPDSRGTRPASAGDCLCSD